MKVRESGMPGEDYWGTFFDPDCVVGKLGCSDSRRGLIEFGCGYGTFTVPAARIAKGLVFAFDIEPEMVAVTREKVEACALSNVVVERRDFIAEGCGRPDASVDHVMLFNILHLENPVGLLAEAYRALIPRGRVSVIHWRSDVETPRGPSLATRPLPEQCREWGEQAGLRFVRSEPLSCCPYHFGLILERPGA